MQSSSTFDGSNVAICRIENFNKYIEQSVKQDCLASELFAFEHPKFGEIVFYLRFCPKTSFNVKSSRLYMEIIKFPREFSASMKCDSWMETADKKRSETKSAKLSFNNNSTCKSWLFLSTKQMDEVIHSTTVFICCRLPYPVKSTGSISTTNKLYRWPITDFNSRFPTAQLGAHWKSDQFEVAEFKGVKFALKFYPKGAIKSRKARCAVRLQLINLFGHLNVPVQLDVWIENAESRLCKLSFKYVFSANGCYEQLAYVKHEELCNFAQNGSIAICWNVRAILELVLLPDISFPNEIGSFFNDPFFSDVEIRVDEHVFKVNRAIISSKSLVFREMFDKKTVEQESGVVTIKDFEASIIEKMLIYIYKIEVINLQECDVELLRVADCYLVQSLVEKCTESIVANLTVDNLLDTLELVFALEHLKNFKNRVLKFTHEHHKEMRQLSRYTHFLTDIPSIAIELFDISCP